MAHHYLFLFTEKSMTSGHYLRANNWRIMCCSVCLCDADSKVMVDVLERPITVHPDPYTLYTGNLSEPVKLVNTYSGSIPYQDTLQFVLKETH